VTVHPPIPIVFFHFRSSSSRQVGITSTALAWPVFAMELHACFNLWLLLWAPAWQLSLPWHFCLVRCRLLLFHWAVGFHAAHPCLVGSHSRCAAAVGMSQALAVVVAWLMANSPVGSWRLLAA
jgi:hypothetical protein